MPSETILDPDRRVPSPILKHVRNILLGGKKVNSKESIEEHRLAILNFGHLESNPGKRNMLFAWLQCPT